MGVGYCLAPNVSIVFVGYGVHSTGRGYASIRFPRILPSLSPSSRGYTLEWTPPFLPSIPSIVDRTVFLLENDAWSWGY